MPLKCIVNAYLKCKCIWCWLILERGGKKTKKKNRSSKYFSTTASATYSNETELWNVQCAGPPLLTERESWQTSILRSSYCKDPTSCQKCRLSEENRQPHTQPAMTEIGRSGGRGRGNGPAIGEMGSAEGKRANCRSTSLMLHYSAGSEITKRVLKRTEPVSSSEPSGPFSTAVHVCFLLSNG